jgi:hypothetical protein
MELHYNALAALLRTAVIYWTFLSRTFHNGNLWKETHSTVHRQRVDPRKECELRQCTVPRAEVMFVTIQHKNICPSKRNEQDCFLFWKWSEYSTLTWMPTYVSILHIPEMIRVWRTTVEWYIDRRKPKNSEENPSQCHLVHKSHMDWAGREPGPQRWEAGD